MIAYGYSVKEHDDPYVDTVEAAVNGFSECLEPGAYLVDVLPLRESCFLLRPIAKDANYISLCYSHPPHARDRSATLTFSFPLRAVRYVPDWFPGAGWKMKAKRFASLLNEMAEVPHQMVKDQMVGW